MFQQVPPIQSSVTIWMTLARVVVITTTVIIIAISITSSCTILPLVYATNVESSIFPIKVNNNMNPSPKYFMNRIAMNRGMKHSMTRQSMKQPLAFVVTPNDYYNYNNRYSNIIQQHTTTIPFVTSSSTTIRQYHATTTLHNNLFRQNQSNNNNDDDNGIIGQIKSVAKKFLPSSWFQSDEERRQKMEQQKIQQVMKSEIQQVLKDAPLPIRMMGNMIGPLFSTMISTVAETAASQQDMINMVYDQAVRSIQRDSTVQQILGDSIDVGRPFSQSSSSSTINGISSTRIELAFPISGRRGNGVGRLVAKSGTQQQQNPMIEVLEVQINGRVIDINTIMSSSSKTTTSNSYISNNRYNGDENIIDAEIIEKDTKRK